MKQIFLACTLALFSITTACTDNRVTTLDDINIIPKPQEITTGSGSFEIGKKVIIVANNEEALLTATYFGDLLEQSSNKKIEIELGDQQKDAINFVLDKAIENNNKEAYILEVTSSQICIKAATQAGLFYGVQSLRQLLPASIESEEPLAINASYKVPAVKIVDEPRFGWRGYMKDVSRTFYGVDVVKKYIDVMSLYKMNVLHLHLTDDQGWRIEIKKYPKLTTTQTTQFPAQYNQPAERSGFYTQADIKALVKYAQERHIEIIPEIDIPGHSWATLLAYPELGVNNNHKPSHVFPFLDSWGHWGNQFTPNSLDPTNEKVYAFLNDVFTEVAELFPAKYIHFGGDEVMHKFWEEQAHIQKYMKKHKMAKVTELQSYFVERVTDIIISKDKLPIGWNDILVDSNLTKKTAIMCWLGENAISQAAENGYYAVATPTHPFYLDITQSDRNDGTMCDLNYGIINSLKAGYEYDPAKGIADENLKYVLGVQANMWPAVPQEVKDINVQNFPRLLALAEVGWSSKEGKDFEQFNARVELNKERLDYLKMDYFTPGGYITAQWAPADITDSYQTKVWDVTKKVYASGRVITGFYQIKGKNSLEIESAELLEDGKVISIDAHHSVAKEKKNIFRPYNYNLEVKNYNPKATYTLRAKIKGADGTDSYGNIAFNLNPYKPFTVVEKK